MKLSTVILLMVGGTLIYSAVKDPPGGPLAVLKGGLQGKAPAKAAPASTTGGTISPLPNSPTPPHTVTSV